MPDHTPYQKGIIKRFYENRDSIAVNKLTEAVSNLYLETSKAKVSRIWKSVNTQLQAAGIPQSRAEEVCEARDLGTLARIVTQLT